MKREYIREHFALLYGIERAELLTGRLTTLLARYGTHLASEPSAPSLESGPVLICYPDHVRAEHETPLRTLARFLGKHLAGLISTVHLLPFYPSSSDDGFSVMDYRQVDPSHGSWEDCTALGRDFRLAFDLVLNHASSQSAWFQGFLSGDPRYAGFFLTAEPDEDLRLVVRPRSHPLLTPFRTDRGLIHLWTTFSADQIDLDFRNPEVLFEFFDILLGYIARGARVLRLDAVAFMWKEAGTPCLHHPKTHAIVRLLRAVVEATGTDTVLLSETNVPHHENLTYFGRGDEAHLIYQFALPPLLAHALLRGTASVLRSWLETTIVGVPPGCNFLNFTASHDGLGVRPLEGLLPKSELDFLVGETQRRGGGVSRKTNTDGTSSPYELNLTYPDLLALETSSRHRRFLLSQGLSLSLRGVPAIYLPSLFGIGNDRAGVEATGRARSINRRKFPLGELEALTYHEPYLSYRRMLELYARTDALHPEASQHLLPSPAEALWFERRAPGNSGPLLVAANCAGHPVELELPAGRWTDLFTGQVHGSGRARGFRLEGYGLSWLVPFVRD